MRWSIPYIPHPAVAGDGENLPMKPRLSICVPSRNRQIYFQQTITHLTRNLRDDVELVLADNSDDAEPMRGFMESFAGDRRVVFLPPTGEVLSMVDNWERTMAASSGEWIVFIGDDDYVDQDLVDLLNRVQAVQPDLDAFSWQLVGYTWPFPERGKCGVFVPFETRVFKLPQTDLLKRMFTWHEAKHVPTSGFSVYHSAISRKLMERIRTLYGGRYFEHPVVDYDNAFKVICTGRSFATTGATLGVMGSCPLSNSFGIGKAKQFKEKTELFIAEAGRNFDNDFDFKFFPFSSLLGTTATIGVAQNWFKRKYKLKWKDWEANFAKACAHDTQSYPDRESFDAAQEGYRAAFKLWKNGKFLRHFKPVYVEKKPEQIVTSGFQATGVNFDQNIAGAKTPGEIFDIIRAIRPPLDTIPVEASGLKYPWEVNNPGSKAA